MKRTLIFLGTAGVVFSGILTGFSRPLVRATLPENPAWLLHVDCDALRLSGVGQFLQTQVDTPAAQAKLAAFQAVFSFDLRTQLHGVTLYGTGTSPEDGILLINADFERERLVTLARAAKDAHEKPYKQHMIFSWVDDKHKTKKGKKEGERRTYAAVLGSRVILGQRENRVAQALDVLTGALPNMASSQAFPQFGAPNDASFIEAAARKLDFIPDEPKAAILKLAKAVRFQLGERDNQLTATLTLEADNQDVADSMTSIAQGLVALGKLEKDPKASKVAQAIKLNQDGASLTARLSLPADQVVEWLKADAARKAREKAAKHKGE